jgi:hypothetical protein
LQSAGDKLQRTPERFGDWILERSQPLDEDSAELLQSTDGTQRIYRNQRTGETVALTLIVGPAGPMSVHTPEVCYSSRDYKTVSPPNRFHVGSGGDAQFWGMTLESTDLEGGGLSVAYGWNDGNGWAAPQMPRFEFGGAPVLYKLQLAAPLEGDNGLKQNNTCRSFLRAFLPALDAVLFKSA